MRRTIIILLIVIAIILAPFIYIFRHNFGFPNVHPIDADCIGIKREYVDSIGIPRIACYGFIYNIWLE